jgi:hypothetical protein
MGHGPLAPPFTRENAAEMARRAVASRMANAAARALTLEKAAKRPPVEIEVHRVVKAMSRLGVTTKEYRTLSTILDSLWSKAFPTQGPQRSRASRSSQQSPVEIVQVLPEN